MKCVAAKFFNQKIITKLTKIKPLKPIEFQNKSAITPLKVIAKSKEKQKKAIMYKIGRMLSKSSLRKKLSIDTNTMMKVKSGKKMKK